MPHPGDARLANVPARVFGDRLFHDGACRDGVVGKEVRRLPVEGVGFGTVVDLVQDPVFWVFFVLTDVETETAGVVPHRLAGVVQQRRRELVLHRGADGDLDEHDVPLAATRTGEQVHGVARHLEAQTGPAQDAGD